MIWSSWKFSVVHILLYWTFQRSFVVQSSIVKALDLFFRDPGWAALLITRCKLHQDNVCQSARRVKSNSNSSPIFCLHFLCFDWRDWRRSSGYIIINQGSPSSSNLGNDYIPPFSCRIYLCIYTFCQYIFKKWEQVKVLNMLSAMKGDAKPKNNDWNRVPMSRPW